MADLRPDSERQWGKMNVAQMLAHCSAWMEMALGLKSPPRTLMGRIFGRAAKSAVLNNEKPLRRNMPSEKSLIVTDERDFEVERQRLLEWTDRLTSLQQRLVKTGERLVKHARYYWLLLAEGHLTRRLFGSMVRRIAVLPIPTG